MKRLLVEAMIFISIFVCSQNLFASPIYNADTDHWYEAIVANDDWYQAEAKAVSSGGHLVAINNATENIWIVQNFGSYLNCWIGFTDVAQEGIWVWISGEPVTYTNWHVGEPNNSGGNEDWAHIYTNMDDPNLISWHGYWNDVTTPTSPHAVYYGIVEYNTNPAVPEPSSILLMGFGGIITAFIKRRHKA